MLVQRQCPNRTTDEPSAQMKRPTSNTRGLPRKRIAPTQQRSISGMPQPLRCWPDWKYCGRITLTSSRWRVGSKSYRHSHSCCMCSVLWTLRPQTVRSVQAFEMKRLRTLLRISFLDSKQNKAKHIKPKQSKVKRTKAKKDRAKQSKAKQNKTKQNKTKQSKAKQSKAKQSKAKQSKTKQNKAKQNKAKQSKTKQGKQSKTKQSKIKQSKEKRSKAKKSRAEKAKQTKQNKVKQSKRK